jgi:hypothetical protein
MAKVGRNDPCPCGSGKKYKNCHLPAEEAARSEQLRLRRAVDTLLPRLIAAARDRAEGIPDALNRYWEGRYTVEQLAELDDLEDRGVDRFLTWYAFDYPLDDGRTLVETLAADPETLNATPEEARLLAEWAGVRLRPYVIEAIRAGRGITVRDLLGEAVTEVEDHAASRRVESGEVLVAHLLPAGTYRYVGGAAAHLTADTREKLAEYLDLHLEALRRDRPDAMWADLLHERSDLLNHFVSKLPVEEPNPGLLESILAQTRTALQIAGVPAGRQADPPPDEARPSFTDDRPGTDG